jgi:hypothetical protein
MTSCTSSSTGSAFLLMHLLSRQTYIRLPCLVWPVATSLPHFQQYASPVKRYLRARLAIVRRSGKVSSVRTTDPSCGGAGCRRLAVSTRLGHRVTGPVDQRQELRVVASLTRREPHRSGRSRRSTLGWVVVLQPPRERPSAWSTGSVQHVTTNFEQAQQARRRRAASALPCVSAPPWRRGQSPRLTHRCCPRPRNWRVPVARRAMPCDSQMLGKGSWSYGPLARRPGSPKPLGPPSRVVGYLRPAVRIRRFATASPLHETQVVRHTGGSDLAGTKGD